MKEFISQILRENFMKINDKDLSIMDIINKYDSLKKGLKFIIINNKSNDAPYHNINHLLTVTKNSYYNLKQSDLLDNYRSELLLLASLFHDYNHSIGKQDDAYNIKQAKKGLKEFLDKEKIDLDYKYICEIIDATQYPYVIDNKQLDKYQKIIRDSDMCQIFEYDNLKQCIFGLSKELNINIIDFIKTQRKFLDSIVFLTKYGKSLKKEKFDSVLKELEILEKIMG